MTKINLLVVEDDPIQQDLVRIFLDTFPFISIVAFVNNGDDLIRMLSQPTHQIHALLLDIDLGKGKSGLESYSILHFRGVQLPTILVTGNVPDASYTFDLGIIDVLEKPFTPHRFRQGMEKLRAHMEYQKYQKDGGLLIPIVNEQIIQLPPSEILFFESINRNVIVHCLAESIETKIPLKTYESYLKEHYFIVTHRSFLVNLKKIDRIDQGKIHFKDDSRFALTTEDNGQEIQLVWETIKLVLN